jgi:hypothetical protein
MSAPSQWPSRPLVEEIAGVLRERIIEGRHEADAPAGAREADRSPSYQPLSER